MFCLWLLAFAYYVTFIDFGFLVYPVHVSLFLFFSVASRGEQGTAALRQHIGTGRTVGSSLDRSAPPFRIRLLFSPLFITQSPPYRPRQSHHSRHAETPAVDTISPLCRCGVMRSQLRSGPAVLDPRLIDDTLALLLLFFSFSFFLFNIWGVLEKLGETCTIFLYTIVIRNEKTRRDSFTASFSGATLGSFII